MAKLISFDVETEGDEDLFDLQPNRLIEGRAKINCVAFAQKVDGAIRTGAKAQPTKSILSDLLKKFAAEDAWIVCWNSTFDIAWLLAMGLRDEVYALRWLDGMLLARHAHNYITGDPRAPGSFSLKAMVRTYIPDEAGYEDGVTFSPQNADEWQALIGYNKLDAKHTLALAEKFLTQLSPEQKRAATLEARCLPMVAEANLRGLAGNEVKATNLYWDLSNLSDQLLEALQDTTGATPEMLASPTQLRNLLYDEWSLVPSVFTDKGAASTNKVALDKLNDPRAKMIRDHREATGNRVKFAEGMRSSLAYNGDGMVRPNARVFGTYTGRMTYGSKTGKGVHERPTGVPLHQWKRGTVYRDLIEAPEGYTLLEFDAAGQEFRWMAEISGDETMLKLCMPGEDPHAFMGAQVNGPDYQAMLAALAADNVDPAISNTRQLGKVANLSLQYRTGAARLREVARVQYGIDMTEQLSRVVHKKYQLSYPGVPRYWSRQKGLVTDQGYAETLAGRRVCVTLPERWSQTFGGVKIEDKRWQYESTAVNFPIQGTGADQKYLALAVLRNELAKFDAHYYFELHDGLFIIAPNAKAEAAAHHIRSVLDALPYKQAWGFTPRIPLPFDAKIGPSWGQLKKVH